MELVTTVMSLPAMKVAILTIRGCIDIANNIMHSTNNVNENEKSHLRELAKMNITLTIATIKSAESTLEKLINHLELCQIDSEINKCIEEIHHQLVMVHSRLGGCNSVGIICDDTTVINESIIRLLYNHFKRLESLASEQIVAPFVSINKVIEEYNKLRPVVYHNEIISIKSDKNENYLGSPGPNPVYKIGGITELTTSKFSKHSRFTIVRFNSGNDLLQATDQDLCPIRFGDEVLFHFEWGYLRHYITGIFQQNWWEYNSCFNNRAIFKIIHPIDSNISRELRFGDRICLLLRVSYLDEWKHRYLSGKLLSRVLKLSSTPYTWTVYNSDGLLNKL